MWQQKMTGFDCVIINGRHGNPLKFKVGKPAKFVCNLNLCDIQMFTKPYNMYRLRGIYVIERIECDHYK